MIRSSASRERWCCTTAPCGRWSAMARSASGSARTPRPAACSSPRAGPGPRTPRSISRSGRCLTRPPSSHPSPPRNVRIHDLRHSFAVRTLLGWYRDGGDVAARMPLLSTYMGHVDPAATLLVLVRRAGAARARRRATRARHGRTAMTALAPTLEAFFTEPADQREGRQPAHDRRLPRHVPAAARIRATADRHNAIEARARATSTRR